MVAAQMRRQLSFHHIKLIQICDTRLTRGVNYILAPSSQFFLLSSKRRLRSLAAGAAVGSSLRIRKDALKRLRENPFLAIAPEKKIVRYVCQYCSRFSQESHEGQLRLNQRDEMNIYP